MNDHVHAVAPANAPKECEMSRLETLRRFVVEQPRGALGAVILLLSTGVALFAPYIAPYDPAQGDPSALSSPPSATYWLGTDAFGRDNLSRLIFGARVSLVVDLGASLLGVAIGALIGIVTAYRGG